MRAPYEVMEFDLPEILQELLSVRNRLRHHYGATGLRFTFDGNLVGDIGEAIAAELFGISLSQRTRAGIDGHAPDGRSVQVKASGCGLGPAFRMVDTRADHLLFFNLDFEACRGVVTFNGPERIALGMMPPTWSGQRALTIAQIRRADALVPDDLRLLSRRSAPSS